MSIIQNYLKQLKLYPTDIDIDISDIDVKSTTFGDTGQVLVIREGGIPSLLRRGQISNFFREIFVHVPGVVIGTHIAFSTQARGGIRLSDREDFRNEALDLAYTQHFKNSCIFPGGGKGCFRPLNNTSAKDAYVAYVSGLLSVLTDDDYLAIAPDKGTCDYSSLANELAIQNNYWMGNAFASGSSNGWSHKKLGITSQGCLSALLTHMGKNTIGNMTMIGIGDMRGDVFGNFIHLVQSNCTLLGAFNGTHIYIDPNPPKIFAAKLNWLFSSQSNWSEVDEHYLSVDGRIFNRNTSHQLIIPEKTATWLNIPNVITPDELIKAMLVAPVDMLFNGGIGTYIYSDAEMKKMDVSEIAVSAKNVLAQAVLEGGNLGISYMGRLELESRGVLVRTDFIDNAGGVICSDLEVTCKLAGYELNWSNFDELVKSEVKNTIAQNVKTILQDSIITNNGIYEVTAAVRENLFNTLGIVYSNHPDSLYQICCGGNNVVGRAYLLSLLRYHLRQDTYHEFHTIPEHFLPFNSTDVNKGLSLNGRVKLSQKWKDSIADYRIINKTLALTGIWIFPAISLNTGKSYSQILKDLLMSKTMSLEEDYILKNNLEGKIQY